MTAANTRHGRFAAHGRAERHYVRTLINRNRLVCAARLLWRYLPPDMAARLGEGPDELATPIHPSNLPYITPQDAMPCNVRNRRKTAATPARTRPGKPAPSPTGRAAERLAVRAEAAAQAPWRQAIAHARAARRTIRQARAAWRQKQAARRNAMQRDNAASPEDRHSDDDPAGPAHPRAAACRPARPGPVAARARRAAGGVARAALRPAAERRHTRAASGIVAGTHCHAT